jgi:hypothetical protein
MELSQFEITFMKAVLLQLVDEKLITKAQFESIYGNQ